MTTPATRHPWLWNANGVRKSLDAYREGKGYGGVIAGDPEVMADDIEDLLEHIDTLEDKIARLEEQ